MKILAIDDKESQLAALSGMLKALIPGCETVTANSGSAGLELARTSRPDFIILDIQMPGMDGFQVCKALKADPGTRHIPVIFLTGQPADSAMRIRGLEIGAEAFLNHPIEPGELISQVRAMVRIKHAEDKLRAETISADSMLRQTLLKQAAILHNTRDAYFALNGEGRLQDVNAAACRMTGYSPAEMLRLAISDLEADDSPAEIAARIQKIKKAGNALFERRFRCRDGRIINVELSVSYLPDSENQIFAFARDITERKLAEQLLRLQRSALEAAANAIIIAGHDGRIEWVNTAFTAITGYSLAEAAGQNSRILKSGKHERAFYNNLWNTVLAGKVWQGEMINKRKDGSFYNEEMTITPLKDERSAVTHFIAVKQDITQLKLLKEQFRQSQKMEAFGQLAGGIAHDFNNILTVIQGNAELVKMNLATVDKEQALQQILAASKRGAGLISQLLAFSRRQVMQARPVDLNDVVVRAAKMLQRLIGENIVLQTQLLPGVAPVQADSGMIEQVLLNFVVNARDAMPNGGRLGIVLENISLDAGAALHRLARPGDFIRLTVNDTGRGIEPAVLPHIFEPFFTTKDVGKGTGLGLANVHGIVQQHQGWIEVVSEPGRGSAFHVYLPRLADVRQLQAEEEILRRVRGGSETILLVEDEPAVRKMAGSALELYGYNVIEAESGLQALELWRQHSAAVDLLLTDIIMPDGVSGSELAVQLRAGKPGLKVIYMSGYSGVAVGCGVDLREGVNFLQKPYVPAKLGQIVRDCLDAL